MTNLFDKANYDSIRSEIECAARTSDKMCQKGVIAGVDPYNPNDKWDAYTYCCADGTYCGTYCCDQGPGKKKQDPCFRKCLYNHEKRHRQQCEGKVTLPTPYYGTPEDPRKPKRWAECDAYSLQMECLLKAFFRRGCGELGFELAQLIAQGRAESKLRGVVVL